MKLIAFNKETLTVQFSQAEFSDLGGAIWEAITHLEREPGKLSDLIEECEGIDDQEEVNGIILDAGREEETLEDLQGALAQAKRLLPKVYELSDGLQRIADGCRIV